MQALLLIIKKGSDPGFWLKIDNWLSSVIKVVV